MLILLDEFRISWIIGFITIWIAFLNLKKNSWIKIYWKNEITEIRKALQFQLSKNLLEKNCLILFIIINIIDNKYLIIFIFILIDTFIYQ